MRDANEKLAWLRAATALLAIAYAISRDACAHTVSAAVGLAALLFVLFSLRARES